MSSVHNGSTHSKWINNAHLWYYSVARSKNCQSPVVLCKCKLLRFWIRIKSKQAMHAIVPFNSVPTCTSLNTAASLCPHATTVGIPPVRKQCAYAPSEWSGKLFQGCHCCLRYVLSVSKWIAVMHTSSSHWQRNLENMSKMARNRSYASPKWSHKGRGTR